MKGDSELREAASGGGQSGEGGSEWGEAVI